MTSTDSSVSSEQHHSNKVTLTIRFIRSFEHRNIKNLVVKDVDLNMTIKDLRQFINEELKKSHLPPPIKNYVYDTLKIEHIPFKAKSSDPVINCLDDEKLLLLVEMNTLSYYHIVNETEISYFKLDEYEAYKKVKESQE